MTYIGSKYLLKISVMYTEIAKSQETHRSVNEVNKFRNVNSRGCTARRTWGHLLLALHLLQVAGPFVL